MSDQREENDKQDSLNGFGTTTLFHHFLAGEREALGPIYRRHHGEMVGTATRFIHCVQMYDPAYDGEDAVDEAWVKICERAQEHQLDWIQSSFQFWKAFYLTLRRAISDRGDSYRAAKRSGSQAFWAEAQTVRRIAREGEESKFAWG